MPHYQELTEVDGTIIASWKLIKYSSFKAMIFEEAQEAHSLKSQILLKAATMH